MTADDPTLHGTLEALRLDLADAVAAADDLLAGRPVSPLSLVVCRFQVEKWLDRLTTPALAPRGRLALSELGVLLLAAKLAETEDAPGPLLRMLTTTARANLAQLLGDVRHQLFRFHAEPLLMAAMPNVSRLRAAAAANPNPGDGTPDRAGSTGDATWR